MSAVVSNRAWIPKLPFRSTSISTSRNRNENPAFWRDGLLICAPGGSRTPNPQLRRLMLYPVELRVRVNVSWFITNLLNKLSSCNIMKIHKFLIHYKLRRLMISNLFIFKRSAFNSLRLSLLWRKKNSCCIFFSFIERGIFIFSSE